MIRRPPISTLTDTLVPYTTLFRSDAEAAGVKGPALRGISQFLRLLGELTELVPEGPGAVLEAALQRSGYLQELEAEHTVESQGRIENRSEEHTSELQSLMRISYAVFCLKKKKKNK